MWLIARPAVRAKRDLIHAWSAPWRCQSGAFDADSIRVVLQVDASLPDVLERSRQYDWRNAKPNGISGYYVDAQPGERIIHIGC